MARNKKALHRFKPIRGYKSSQNPPRRRVGSKPSQRCKSKNRNRSLSPWRSGWRETIRNMSTWTEDHTNNPKESISSQEHETTPSIPTLDANEISSKSSSQRSKVSKTGSLSSNVNKSSGTVSNCSIKPQILKMESKPVQLKQLERQDQKSPREDLGRNFSLLELKMEVYVTRLRELEWEREQLLADRKEKLHAARQNKVKVAN
eukprot:TRINITY_DN14535_c0_g1_i2.p1 TRINITY_DN14535_c0_g1~~TRINITY_DN14535_c0_g1_i2.p1  ORF type:complete len:204 (-),score=23.92 TRINITY_DN14535_c0_g1_i2:115-726(-)